MDVKSFVNWLNLADAIEVDSNFICYPHVVCDDIEFDANDIIAMFAQDSENEEAIQITPKEILTGHLEDEKFVMDCCTLQRLFKERKNNNHQQEISHVS